MNGSPPHTKKKTPTKTDTIISFWNFRGVKKARRHYCQGVGGCCGFDFYDKAYTIAASGQSFFEWVRQLFLVIALLCRT